MMRPKAGRYWKTLDKRRKLPMLMDKVYEGNEARQLVTDLGMIPVVPLKSNRLDP
jgi:hypothetical protein